jgi:hypothetical protein
MDMQTLTLVPIHCLPESTAFEDPVKLHLDLPSIS